MRKRLAVPVAMALMLAKVAATSGAASARPGGQHGQVAVHTFHIPRAQFGIASASAHDFSGGCQQAGPVRLVSCDICDGRDL